MTELVEIIGFTGHRDWLCNEQSLLRLEERYPDATWIHGDALSGFDRQVDEVALEIGKIPDVTLLRIRPDYKKYAPNIAPLMRNDVIVIRCNILVACFDGRKSGGTLYTINRAKQASKPIEYVTPVTRVKVPLKV